jgi:hypothetical protein
MLQIHDRGLRLLACGVLATLCACSRENQDEMGWARAALERNTAIEIVAADQKTHTFTIRDKASGAVSTLRADEVVAAPTLAANSAPAAGAPASSAPAAASAAPSATPSAPAPVAAPDASDTQSASPAPTQALHAQPASLAPQSATVSAENASGRVLESGPGYTIKAATASVSVASGTRDTGITSAPLERRYEPIVCQGARLLHIDNRNLVFTGDAVAAEDGCEIHITNSRISATGVGVSARAANVHIDNSLIEGEQASIDASEGGQVYAESSHFKGLSRQLDSAAFHDLGGNIWN